MSQEAVSYERDEEGYIKLIAVEEVSADKMTQIIIEDWEVDIGIALVDGQYYTFRDVCPHMLFPLTVGQIRGNLLVCAGHLWRFDLKQGGRAVYPPINKAMQFYPHKIHDGYIWVKIPNH